MERFITSPNLPENMVSLVLADGRIRESMVSGLESRGVHVVRTEPCPMLYDAISCHPDMYIHHLGGKNIIAAPNAPASVVDRLIELDFNILKGQKSLTSKYPGNIAYNVARMWDYAICNISSSDPVLIDSLVESGVKLINIKQGYAKCSLCIAGYGIVITSDDGIYKILSKYDFQVLKIKPGFIELKGLNYGFIGGAASLISSNTLAFAGNALVHPDFDKIIRFASQNNIDIRMLDDGLLTDLGTIVPLKEYCM